MSGAQPNYLQLAEHYAACFAQHGATPKGVDWPKAEDALTRQRVMLGVVRETPASLIDIGCGYGALREVIQADGLSLEYSGLDLNEPMLEAARARHPGVSFERRDILANPLPESSFDYAVMNGVFTEKRGLSFEAMEEFAQAMILAAFRTCRKGLAFNVMRAQVDWQRDDLFHMPYDRLAEFLTRRVSRHFTFRADYGLYEYTAYVYRNPVIHA